jgi:hypothetical protein
MTGVSCVRGTYRAHIRVSWHSDDHFRCPSFQEQDGPDAITAAGYHSRVDGENLGDAE